MTKVIPFSEIKDRNKRGRKRIKQQIVATALLFEEHKALLIQRGPNEEPDPGGWGPPCGKVEFMEDPARAAERECFEETGVRVKAKKLLSIENYTYETKTEQIHLIECIYVVERVNKTKKLKVTLDKEHVAFQFVEAEKCSRVKGLAISRQRIIQRALKTQIFSKKSCHINSKEKQA